MSRNTSIDKEFRQFRELLENDPILKEIVDSTTSETMQQRRHLLIPYVSAPPLVENPWK
jgi:hypothetical protein